MTTRAAACSARCYGANIDAGSPVSTALLTIVQARQHERRDESRHDITPELSTQRPQPAQDDLSSKQYTFLFQNV